jgi:hypothetical protein
MSCRSKLWSFVADIEGFYISHEDRGMEASILMQAYSWNTILK